MYGWTRILTRLVAVVGSVSTLCTGAALPHAHAQALAPDQALPTDPRLVQGEFGNGMRYIVMRHAVPPARAAVWLHVSTGSLNETDAQRGIAHFLEHMAFNGSAHFPPGTVVDFFQSLGLTFGRHQNASTRFDRTGYRLEMPDNSAQTVEKALLFLSDVAFNLTLPSDEIEKERGIILEEKRTRVGAQQRVQESWIKQMAPGSTMGERIPIGVEETILGMSPQDFRDYYATWYVPSNMAVCMVADMDEKVMVDMLRARFSGGERKARPADRPTGIKPYESTRGVIISDPELTRASVSIVRIAPPRDPVRTVGRLREQLVEQVGLAAFNRRLDKKIAKGKMSFLNAGMSAGNFVGVVRAVNIQAGGEASKWELMLRELGTEVARARLHGLDKTEVEDVLREIVSSAEVAVQTDATRQAITILSSWDEALGSDEIITSAAQDLELIRALSAGISSNEISKAFATLVAPGAMTFMLQAPAGAALPGEADLARIGVEALGVAPEAESAVARPTALMTELPNPGSSTHSSVHEATGVKTVHYANGVIAHFRSMDYKKNQVTISITLAGGELLEDAGNRGITDAGVLAWNRAASSTLASTEIEDLKIGKKAGVGGFAQPDAVLLTISGAPEDLEFGMQLAHLMLTDSVLEGAAFDQWKTQQLQAIESSAFSPRGVLTRLMATTVFPADNVRVQPLTQANIHAISREAAQAWIRRLASESPIEVAVVGDLSIAEGERLVARYVASLPARTRISNETFADRRILVKPSTARTASAEVKTKSDQAQVIAGFYGADISNANDGRLMNAAAQILTSRMIKKVREEEQLVYSIRASHNPSGPYPGFGMFMAGAPTKPDKADLLGVRLQEMYATFAKDGPTDEEVGVVKRQIANSIGEQMMEPGYWLRRVQTIAYRGTSLDDLMGDAAAYAAMTGAQIQACFARYHGANNAWTIVIKPSPAAP